MVDTFWITTGAAIYAAIIAAALALSLLEMIVSSVALAFAPTAVAA